MLSETEKIVLDIINERSLITKTELLEAIKKPNGVALIAAKNLVNKGLVQILYPMGEASFAITQKGFKYLEGKL